MGSQHCDSRIPILQCCLQWLLGRVLATQSEACPALRHGFGLTNIHQGFGQLSSGQHLYLTTWVRVRELKRPDIQDWTALTDVHVRNGSQKPLSQVFCRRSLASYSSFLRRQILPAFATDFNQKFIEFGSTRDSDLWHPLFRSTSSLWGGECSLKIIFEQRRNVNFRGRGSVQINHGDNRRR